LELADFIEIIREKSDPKGRVILLMRPKMVLKRFTPEQRARNPRAVLRYNFWVFEKLSFNPQVQVNGVVLVNNFKGLTFYEQMALSNISSVSDRVAILQHFQTLGMRFKAAYIVEEPQFISWLWFCVKPFLSEKFTSRFSLCGKDYSKLHSGFPDLSVLPLDVRCRDVPAITDPALMDSTWLREAVATRGRS
jgi:hypothetical protein